MNFERFEREFSNLANLFRKEGFFKGGMLASDFKEVDLYAKFLDYRLYLRIITSRLESEITEFISINDSFLECFRRGTQPNLEKAEELITVLSKISLDFSDFYIHTRIFLDILNMCIKISFKNAGNRNWEVMKDSISGLLNERKMQTYKRQIDPKFFEGLEKGISWVCYLRDSRDRLVHEMHHFVYTDTRQDEKGYDLIGKVGRTWGIETVKPILKEVQGFLDNLSDLMKYLHESLPRTQQQL